MNRQDLLNRIQRLWDDFLLAPYPEACAVRDIRWVEVILLDSYAAGCVSSFLHNEGFLDLQRTAVLGLCYGDLTVVLTELKGEGRAYFARLEELVRLVLEFVRDEAKEE